MDFNDYIKTYEELSRQVCDMMLANEIASRPLELINGDLEDEIFQYYIISTPCFSIAFQLVKVFNFHVYTLNEVRFQHPNSQKHRWGLENDQLLRLINSVFSFFVMRFSSFMN